MTKPITDSELANLRVWLGRFPETSATTTVQLKSLIARIDLERNRADAAEAEAEVARLRAVYDAVEAYGANNDLSHDETGEGPHDRRRCRTCRLVDAFGAAALAKLDNLGGTDA